MNNAIKLSVIASALTFAVSSASAMQIYSKDDTTLDVTGFVHAVYHSGHMDNVSDPGDSTIKDRVRFGLSGRTKLGGDIYGLGKYEIQNDQTGTSKEEVDTELRDCYAGIDFGKFGVLKVGRYLDNMYKIEETTDVFEDLGAEGQQFTNRNSGKINYEFNYAGFSAAFELQTAVDHFSYIEDVNVERGYSVVLGYTSPDVLFGPIGIQASYGYLGFQDDDEVYDDADNFGVALTWGNYGSGLYLATWYEQSKLSYNTPATDDSKIKSSETAVAYGFDNGIILQAEYTWKDYVGGDAVSKISRKATAFVGYNASENFFVWADVNFDAGSSHGTDIEKDGDVDTLYTVGARFVF